MKNITKNHASVKVLCLCFFVLFCMLLTVMMPVHANAGGKTHNITIELNKKSSKKNILLTKGHKIKISANSGNKTLSGKNLKYTSSNKSIAKVTNKGVITGRKNGKCKITITTKDKKKKCVITLKIVKDVAVNSVTLDATSIQIKKGESKSITAMVMPVTATNQKVVFSSSDASVATVSSSGNITAVGAGQATVTATADGKSATCTVTVTEDAQGNSDDSGGSGEGDDQSNSEGDDQGKSDTKVTSIALNYTTRKISIGGTFTLEPTISPANATNKNVTYKSSNTAVATVTAAGIVKGVTAGTATITCTAADGSGISKTCSVNVIDAVIAGASGDVSYALYKTSDTTYKLEITGNGAMADYTWSYGDYNTPWHAYKGYITELVIENGVTYLGEHAFDNQTALTALVIPTSVTSIGEGAFYVTFDRNPALTSITLNEGLKTIGEDAFRNQKNVSGTLTIPSTVTSIGASAFSMNDHGAITSIVFANGSRLTSIGNYAFKNNDSLTCGIVFPDSLKSIGNSAFQGCCIYTNGTGITSVSFGVNSQLETIGDRAFDSIYKLASITLPSSVTSIGAGAFAQDASAHDLTRINYRGTADQYWTLCNTNAISVTGNDNIRVSESGAATTMSNVAIQYGVQ